MKLQAEWKFKLSFALKSYLVYSDDIILVV